MDRLSDIVSNRQVSAYGAAILLHLLFFMMYVPIKSFLGDETQLQAKVDAEPLSFEFVDIPEDSKPEVPTEKTSLVSRRSTVSRDNNDSELPKSHLPFSDGLVASKENMQTVIGKDGEEGKEGKVAEADERSSDTEEQNPAYRKFENQTDFASIIREGKKDQKREDAIFGSPTIPTSLQMTNKQSRALDRGGLKLSTYDWEFAPYLAYLKQHIGGHINPPAAFTQYGLIDGQTRVRFKIMPDGTLRDLVVLGYKGSRDLRDTSTRAVEYSADFKPLPAHFPEEYLEITAFFDYVLMRRTP
jgi:outer membrane biosynthesis protein TonB